MPAHPGRSASAKPGTSSGGWSRRTPPARRLRDENRAPDTLVDATSCAIADVGSIPTVSTNFTDRAEARIRPLCRDNRPLAVRRAAHEIRRDLRARDRLWGANREQAAPHAATVLPSGPPHQARDQHIAQRGAIELLLYVHPLQRRPERTRLRRGLEAVDLLHAMQASGSADFGLSAGHSLIPAVGFAARVSAEFASISDRTGPREGVFGPAFTLPGLEDVGQVVSSRPGSRARRETRSAWRCLAAAAGSSAGRVVLVVVRVVAVAHLAAVALFVVGRSWRPSRTNHGLRRADTVDRGDVGDRTKHDVGVLHALVASPYPGPLASQRQSRWWRAASLHYLTVVEM